MREGDLNQTEIVTDGTRFVGLDVHRRYATVAAVDGKQQVVLTARRIEFEDFDVWMSQRSSVPPRVSRTSPRWSPRWAKRECASRRTSTMRR